MVSQYTYSMADHLDYGKEQQQSPSQSVFAVIDECKVNYTVNSQQDSLKHESRKLQSFTDHHSPESLQIRRSVYGKPRSSSLDEIPIFEH